MKQLSWCIVLCTAFTFSMEDPRAFARITKFKNDESLQKDTNFPIPTAKSLELDACGMCATMATMSCCLHAVCNTNCGTGLLLGACSYLALSCLIADETDEEWVTECYTGRASLYLKKKITQKSNSLFCCLTRKSAKKQE